jgi:hypothetical protein
VVMMMVVVEALLDVAVRVVVEMEFFSVKYFCINCYVLFILFIRRQKKIMKSKSSVRVVLYYFPQNLSLHHVHILSPTNHRLLGFSVFHSPFTGRYFFLNHHSLLTLT